MLYIASALTPTAILDTRLITDFTSSGSSSLIVAKPDRIEVWDTDKSGLVKRAELELWGSVAGIEPVVMKDARPHLLVLLTPPNAHLLLMSFSSGVVPSLVVTSAVPLVPPTPSLRHAEFFTSVISQGNVALVSLWTGVLSCIDMEIEKEKEAKRRRSSVAAFSNNEEGKRLVFKDNFNINVREHNLIHLAFLPPISSDSEPMLTFLWLSSGSALMLGTRKLSLLAHSFVECSRALDVVSPTKSGIDFDDDTDFNDLPFACPAARRVLPIPSSSGSKFALVIGDEHCVLYSISDAPISPKVRRPSNSSVTTSPRAASRRSPQTEMHGSVGKRRKSSMTTKGLGEEGGESWEVKPVWRVRQGFGTVLAATVLQAHPDGASILLGDECGRLTVIGWHFEQSETVGVPSYFSRGTVRVRKVDMGSVSPPSSLTYLDASHLFVSSACGDSGLMRLALPQPKQPSSMSSPTAARPIPGRKGKSRAKTEGEESPWLITLEDEDQQGVVDVKERWLNLAPLKDFCVIEEDGGNISHLVVASGASTSNSLHVVRSGVGMEDVVTIEGVRDMQRIWAVSTPAEQYLLLSSNAATTVLLIGDEITEVDIALPIASEPTLAASSTSGGGLIRVTHSSVSLWSDFHAETPVAAWQVNDGELVAAQVTGNLVAVAKRGGYLVVLTVSADSLEPIITSKMPSEISALDLFFSPIFASPIVAVSLWTNEVLLHTLETLRSPDALALRVSEAFSATALQFKVSNATTGVQLLAGLSDGSLVVYDIALSDGRLSVKGRKVSSLGTRPLLLCPVSIALGDEQVVAIGLSERMSVVFESKDRIEFSSVNKKDVTAAAALTTTTHGDCLVFATPSGLSLVKINSLKKLSVQTLDTHERSVTKLASIPEYNVLGVGSVTRSMDAQSGDVQQRGYFELRDSTSLRQLAELALNMREEVTSLNSVFLMGRHYLTVGTAVFPSDEDFDQATYAGGRMVTSREGRLLLVEPFYDTVNDEWVINLVTSMKTDGPVHGTIAIHGFLAVAAASRVSIQRLDAILQKLTEVSHFSSLFVAQHLHVSTNSKLHSEDRLVVGDGMRSIFVLEIDEDSGMIFGDQRDMATHSVSALQGIRDGGNGVIIADGYSNLLTFRFKESIETAASFGLHEDVARFRPGALAPPTSALEVINPDLLYATTDGRLGIIGELTTGAAKTLDDLQRNMNKYYKGPGGITWETFRRGGTELIKKETAGFIDGDFVQKFLDADLLPSSEASKILTGTNQHEHVSRSMPDGSGKEPAERADVARVLEAAAGLH